MELADIEDEIDFHKVALLLKEMGDMDYLDSKPGFAWIGKLIYCVRTRMTCATYVDRQRERRSSQKRRGGTLLHCVLYSSLNQSCYHLYLF